MLKIKHLPNFSFFMNMKKMANIGVERDEYRCDLIIIVESQTFQIHVDKLNGKRNIFEYLI